MRIRLDLAYDGAGFHGVAVQPEGLPTVGGVLRDALIRLGGDGDTLVVAGRTDKGVHALGQVAHVDAAADSRLVRDPQAARAALDGMCGPPITIWRVRRVPASFHARFSAVQRRYRYRLCDAPALDPLARGHTWHVGGPPLDIPAMRAGGGHLLGEHDFDAFCRRGGQTHLRRRVDELTLRRRPHGMLEVTVAGPAFCQQMVRSIVAALVAVGRRRRTPAWIAEALAGRDRAAIGAIAPPHGLVLTAVRYPSGRQVEAEAFPA